MLTFPSPMERARDQAAPCAEPPVAAQPNGERESCDTEKLGTPSQKRFILCGSKGARAREMRTAASR
jgi:hypothetical protein